MSVGISVFEELGDARLNCFNCAASGIYAQSAFLLNIFKFDIK